MPTPVSPLDAVTLLADTGLAPADPQSPNNERIRDTYYLILAFAAAIFLLVQGALILFAVRYRRGRRTREEEGAQVHGHTRFELAWTAVPVVILTIVAAFVFYKLPGIKDPPSAEAAPNRLRVTVEGRQYYWRFLYPDGQISYDTLVAPVRRPVLLTVTAPDHDVIHSWWINSLGGKFDAIPGETTETWFQAKRTGTFLGQCGEFCGLRHAAMLSRARIVEESEFSGWLTSRRSEQERASASFGRTIFQAACAKCHSLEADRTIVGPSLKGNPTLADAKALEQIVRNGRNEMPAVGRGWTDAEMRALLAYTKTQGGDGGGEG